MLHATVSLLYDGEPTSAPEDATQQAVVDAMRLRDSGDARKGMTVYRPARPDNDMPEGPWTYAKPAGRSYWRATFAAFLLSALPPFAASAQQAPAPCKVNLNTATAEQLAYLIQTGPVLAARVIEARTAANGKLDAATLDAVKGVGEKWLAYNAPFIAFDGATTCTAKLSKPKVVGGKDGAQ